MMRTVFLIAGALLVAFGLLALLIEFDNLAEGTGKNINFGLGLCALLIAAGSGLLWRGMRKPSAADAEGSAEDIVLRLARENGGTITAAAVAAHSRLSYVEADRELVRLSSLGACDAIDGDGAALAFRFGGLATTGSDHP